ncbi:hypothetical protein [Mucilaginibacter jinjuensis]|uniref:Uncharacterized protein n=1 Tax=Mucilaginibacter jinjuensis TaxID=1176721 RepID=A0ABY7T2C3_9SPHI|nr:hypothetical protein [Mucilaginibacter jinjuensis]WCT09876.1 hypothetical protein PQO05_14170 [Mucilaginibacter jinjuensis]
MHEYELLLKQRDEMDLKLNLLNEDYRNCKGNDLQSIYIAGKIAVYTLQLCNILKHLAAYQQFRNKR